MTIYNGRDLIVKIGDGADANEVFDEIDGIYNSSIKYQTKFFDKNDLSSSDWQVIKTNESSKSVSISIEGIYNSSDSSNRLRSSAFLGNNSNYEIIFGSGEKITGSFIVTEYERSGKEKSEEHFKAKLQSSDKINYVSI